MSNLTISVPSDLLKRARLRALEEDTSVNAVLGAYLEAYSRADADLRRRERAVARILHLAQHRGPAVAGAAAAGMGSMGADVWCLDIDRSAASQVSFWDGIIIETALTEDDRRLVSEDLQDG